MVGCQFVYGLAIYVGLIFLIAPGIFFAVRWVFAPIYLIDHPEASIGEALRASWDKTADHFWPLLGLGIVTGLIAGAGFGGLLRGLFLHHDDSLHRTSDHLPSALAGRRGACE